VLASGNVGKVKKKVKKVEKDSDEIFLNDLGKKIAKMIKTASEKLKLEREERIAGENPDEKLNVIRIQPSVSDVDSDLMIPPYKGNWNYVSYLDKTKPKSLTTVVTDSNKVYKIKKKGDLDLSRITFDDRAKNRPVGKRKVKKVLSLLRDVDSDIVQHKNNVLNISKEETKPKSVNSRKKIHAPNTSFDANRSSPKFSHSANFKIYPLKPTQETSMNIGKRTALKRKPEMSKFAEDFVVLKIQPTPANLPNLTECPGEVSTQSESFENPHFNELGISRHHGQIKARPKPATRLKPTHASAMDLEC
jgi:hypothetical protein